MGTPIGGIIEREEITLDFLNGRIVGIDAFNMLYQFLSIIRSYDGSLLADSKGRVTSHLSGLFYRTTNLVEKGIKPVFVFDGKAPELKSLTQKKRHTARKTAEKKFEQALKEGKIVEAKKFAMQASQLTEEMIDSAKKLIELMGFPIVQAQSEGEAQIAFMVSKGELFGCVSQDYDALLFGSEQLFRNIAISGKRKAPGKNYFIDVKPERIELKKNLDGLGIDRKKLIWLGILVGTDFNEKFPKVGVKTALKLVQECKGFEEIIKKTKHTPRFDYREIEEIFLNPSYSKNYEIKFSTPDRNKIEEFLVEEHDFSKDRVQNNLDKLMQKMQERGKQARLQQWQ